MNITSVRIRLKRMKISSFLCERYDLKTESWLKETIYYYGDFTNVDLNTDWRFREVPNKRKQLIFLGFVKRPSRWNKI